MAGSGNRKSVSNSSDFPLAGVTRDGWSTDDRATATCYCGTVQLSFPTQGPGLGGRFVCHCHDCRKITASMFASNFTINDEYLVHERGRDKLSTFSQCNSIPNNRTMTNYFCSNCGTLMYRVGSGWPGYSILRIGTVDDVSLHETKLRPQVEQFVDCRVGWLQDAKGKDGAGKMEQAGRQFADFERSAVNPEPAGSKGSAGANSIL
ncbi:Mss4-like protein [Microdochium trichocladiopsis]|uniref:Mss4-like protein n=1 Tax=Microdochium trichocladiopsis TaxID=1682393 RepID=A0A9P8YG48_9PEZI|nr:Mss4-like protein [Microdochium trichocladiopsis]KAH7037359.1 Mss4-like protein [Microdochium trichocladiopsis]